MKKNGNQLSLGVPGEIRDEVRFLIGPDSEVRYLEPTDTTPPRLTGYAARFNTRSKPIETTRGQFVETIQPGAFRSALASGENTVLRIEHGKHGQLPLADTATGTLRLNEDSIGLRYEADLDPTDPDVQSMLPKVKRGTLRSMSFNFRVAKGGDHWERRDGGLHRTIMNIGTLRDIAPVTFPAYPETSLALRSLESFDTEHPEMRLLADEPADTAEVANNLSTGKDNDTTAKPETAFKVGQTVVMVPSEPEYDAPWAPKGTVGTVSDVSNGPFYQVDLGGYKVFVPENRLKGVTIDPAKAVRSAADETELRRRRLRLHAQSDALADETRAAIAKRDDIDPKAGTKKYGDVKFADAVNNKYPIDTEKHIRAAWNYTNKGSNDEKYSAAEVKTIKARIVAAWKDKIDKDGPPSAGD